MGVGRAGAPAMYLFSFHMISDVYPGFTRCVHLGLVMGRGHCMMYLFILKTQGRKLHGAHEKQSWGRVEACFDLSGMDPA